MFNGLARNPKIIVGMEDEMRDALHTIRSKRLQERGPSGQLTWSFDTSMTVAPRTPATYVAHLKPQDGTSQQVAIGAQNATTQTTNTTAQTAAQPFRKLRCRRWRIFAHLLQFGNLADYPLKGEQEDEDDEKER